MGTSGIANNEVDAGRRQVLEQRPDEQVAQVLAEDAEKQSARASTSDEATPTSTTTSAAGVIIQRSLSNKRSTAISSSVSADFKYVILSLIRRSPEDPEIYSRMMCSADTFVMFSGISNVE